VPEAMRPKKISVNGQPRLKAVETDAGDDAVDAA